MNNTLKFRVWDKKHRTYEHDSAGAYFIDMLGDLIFIKEEDDNMDRVQGENFMVERCTGLRDKNGKLIHANDVVRFYWTEQAPQEFVVKWNNRRCCFDFYVYKKHKRGCKFGQWYLCFDSGECKYCEIIGNIHEMEVPQ